MVVGSIANTIFQFENKFLFVGKEEIFNTFRALSIYDGGGWYTYNDLIIEQISL